MLSFARTAPPAPAQGDATFDGLRRFQHDNGLKVDGLMRPNGPTVDALNRNLMQVSSAAGGGWIGKNFSDLVQPINDPNPPPKMSEGSDSLLSVKPKDNFNMDRFIATLNRKAENASQDRCAKYVRIALEAGGADTSMRLHGGEAKYYDNVLKSNGFTPVEIISEEDYVPQTGDIVIFQPYPGGHQAGHIQVWNGEQWVSDFRQPGKFWPDSKYKAAKKPFQVYRRSH